MQIQLIRNATLRLTYNNHIILIDPYFAPKHSLPSFADKSKNPTVELPIDTTSIMNGVELVIVSHLHTDHFDSVAKTLLPKNLPLLCQSGDETAIREAGFQNVQPLEDTTVWNGLTITRTDGQHGEGETATLMGNVSGFVFAAPNEPTLYWAGDTIWYAPVERVIRLYKPDVIVTHSCGATWKGSPPIVMDAAQTVGVCRSAPTSQVVAVHMEALDHATVSRNELRDYASYHDVSPRQLLIPDDGEVLEFEIVTDD